jgi:UDP-2,3-diacylglucosamine pyrophosphatase LpxH
MINHRIKILFINLLIIFSSLSLLLVLSSCKKSETKTSISTPISSSESITETQVSLTSVEASTATGTTNEISFSFSVSGDNRPVNNDLPEPQNFIDILDSIKTFDPVFYISTGDIINGGSNDAAIINRQFQDYLKAISSLNCPVYVAAGNHEVQNDTGRNSFDKLFSNNGKTYYYFDYQGVHFIILDAYENGNWGAIKGDELSWLKNLLPTLSTEKLFVFVHPPVYSYLNPDCITDGSKFISFTDKKNQNDIRKLFKDNNVDGVFSGHEHMFHMQKEGNIEYVITGLSGAEPYVSEKEGGFYHFCMIDVKENSWVLKVMDINGNLKEENEINFN